MNYNDFQLFQVLLEILLYVDDQYVTSRHCETNYRFYHITYIMIRMIIILRFACPWIDQQNTGYHM